jgi:uncharacterized phiE125 gp8 family phage protein
MYGTLQPVTAPVAEPISLTEAKTHLRQTAISADDLLIGALVSAARAYAESKCARQIIAARWLLTLDAFPGPSLMGVPSGQAFTLPGHAVIIPRAPVLQIVSIKYLDMSGATQTLVEGTDYVVDLTSEPARITPPFGKIWPVTLPQIGAVQVVFDCGHAAKTAANAGADTITVTGWKTLLTGDTVRLINRDGALPAPLVANTDYYIQSVISSGVYKLAATSGGAAIDITDAGTGEHFLGSGNEILPQGMLSWCKLSLGTLYENREFVTIDQRITSAALPTEFIDGLLDPYRMNLY